MPEPDLMVLEPRPDFYRAVPLRPEHVLLLIEVAETSLRYDREVKLPLYAAAGVRECWIVDIEGHGVEIYRTPTARRYLRIERAGPRRLLRPRSLPRPHAHRRRHSRLTRLTPATISAGRPARPPRVCVQGTGLVSELSRVV